jgi:hypothetical protein
MCLKSGGGLSPLLRIFITSQGLIESYSFVFAEWYFMNLFPKVDRGTVIQLLAFSLSLFFFLWMTSRDHVENVAFLIVGVIVAIPFLLLRGVAQWSLGQHWKIPYVRLAVDTASGGLLLLLIATLIPEHHHYGSLPASTEKMITSKWSEVSTSHGNWNQAAKDSIRRLRSLVKLQWFIEHFPAFVILPCGFVVLCGYNLDRRKHARKQTSI